jgi:hypothetical protein
VFVEATAQLALLLYNKLEYSAINQGAILEIFGDQVVPHLRGQVEDEHGHALKVVQGIHPQNVRFQNVRFQNVWFQNVRFQNVRFTKRQVYKTSGFKTSGLKMSIF